MKTKIDVCAFHPAKTFGFTRIAIWVLWVWQNFSKSVLLFFIFCASLRYRKLAIWRRPLLAAGCQSIVDIYKRLPLFCAWALHLLSFYCFYTLTSVLFPFLSYFLVLLHQSLLRCVVSFSTISSPRFAIKELNASLFFFLVPSSFYSLVQ